ncbi:MAG: hypothetical protein U0228_25970 [Myxococcaceae bacterium]
MQTHDLDGLSWVATPGTLDALPPSLTAGLSLSPAPLDQPTVRAACFRHDRRVCFAAVNGWTYAFGFQLGLGGLALAVSQVRGVALSFENDGKRGVRLCSVYRAGALVRQVSDVDGAFHEEGAPLPGEPALQGTLDDATVAALARAWGADPGALAWGSAGMLGAPPLVSQWPLWVGVAAVVTLAVLGVRAVPSKAERCHRGCERSWKATLANTPECRGQAMETCDFYREAVRQCVEQCDAPVSK